MANNAINLDNLMSRIAAVSGDEIRLAVLQDEIEIYKSRLNPSDSKIDILYLEDTISVITRRIEEIT
tara:strand:+ start:288 stop:488 length:201 start_codon:yes stop_codon:yes gene_type:complete